MEVQMEIEIFDCADRLPPKGVAVIVAGGVAMMKTGGEWFTGMEEPLFGRPLEWVPKWWAAIPGDNVKPVLKFTQ